MSTKPNAEAVEGKDIQRVTTLLCYARQRWFKSQQVSVGAANSARAWAIDTTNMTESQTRDEKGIRASKRRPASDPRIRIEFVDFGNRQNDHETASIVNW
jgi:hypothetical protein